MGTKLNMSHQSAFATKKDSSILSCIRCGVLPASQRRWSFSIQYWWSHTLSAVSSSGLPSAQETQTYWSEYDKGPQWQWRNCNTSPMRKRQSWDFLAEEGLEDGVVEHFIAFQSFQYLEGGFKHSRSRLFSLVPTDRIRDNGHSVWTSGNNSFLCGCPSNGTDSKGFLPWRDS